MRKFFQHFLIFSGLFGHAIAHPISLSTALINVSEDVITVDITIYLEDLALFYWMDADQSFRRSTDGYRQRALEHGDFLLKHLHLLDESGNRLQGLVREVDHSELTGVDTITNDQLMEFSLRYELDFPLEQIPRYLTIQQDFGGEQPPVPAEMEVNLFLKGVAFDRSMLSHGALHTVDLGVLAELDIEGESLDAVRERVRAREPELLGITSYSKVYSYLYVNERGIRHEVLIPLLQLDEWLSFSLERGRELSVAEQERVKEPIRAFFERYQRVQVDEGQELGMSSMDIRFFGPGIRDFAMLGKAQALMVHNARVGIIMDYVTVAPVREFAFHWGYYASRFPFMEGWFYAYEEPREDFSLYSARVPFRWVDANPLERIEFLTLAAVEPLRRWPVPLLSTGCVLLAFAGLAWCWFGCHSKVGVRILWLLVLALISAAFVLREKALWQPVSPLQSRPKVDTALVNDTASKLLQNIYQSFVFTEDEAVHDALARSVRGPLLRSLYMDLRRSIVNREQGGALARIHAIEMRESIVRSSGAAGAWPQIVLECEWTVLGSVEHWGHVHIRKNLHRAQLGLVAGADGWKLEHYEPLTEARVEDFIRVRQ